MSLLGDMWMSPAKRRLIRRTVANGPYDHGDLPAGTESFTNIIVDPSDPGPEFLKATGSAASAFVNADLVIFITDEDTGTPEARDALQTLRAAVESVAGAVVVFRTSPTDLSDSGIDFTGLVIEVVPVD